MKDLQMAAAWLVLIAALMAGSMTGKEIADDLESEVEARRSAYLDRRIERDLIVVKEARVLLDEQEQGDE
jgi:hypothetical protein